MVVVQASLREHGPNTSHSVFEDFNKPVTTSATLNHRNQIHFEIQLCKVAALPTLTATIHYNTSGKTGSDHAIIVGIVLTVGREETLYHYDVIGGGGKVGTKWKKIHKNMHGFVLPCLNLRESARTCTFSLCILKHYMLGSL